MRPLRLLACLLFALALPTLIPASIPAALAAANHVVISEYATRGPASATDEFVELYNPTNAPISLSGWRMQYNPASGSGWLDRAVLPANASIAAHGYFLLANQSYTGSVVADFSSGGWNSGTGMADAGGHVQIINASAVMVDKAGWGTAAIPEGSAAPAMTVGTVSVERKALASSTADSLAAGGAHSLLGNGQDTNVNSADFVIQTQGRNPQNVLSPLEPSFASGGNGTGLASVMPTPVYAGQPLDSLRFTFKQDSSYVLTSLAVQVPTAWTWSHLAGAVVLGGPAFAGATASVVGDTIFVSGATLSSSDSGTVIMADLTTPATSGSSIFLVRTAVAAGTLTSIAQQPSVRVLKLVPILAVHVNDANGVPTSPYGLGSEVTVSGTVTANMGTTYTDVYIQDGTAGINLYSGALLPITLALGDSITITGSILQFRGLTEVQPDITLLARVATGRPVPAPLVLTCAQVNATFQPDRTEPNEGRLVRVNGLTYNSTASTVTDVTGTTAVYIPVSFPPTPSTFDLIGILKQYKAGTPAPGPPYTAEYELVPRTADDIITQGGPVILTTPYDDNYLASSVQVHWTTDVASSSIVRYGTTTAFGDSAIDLTPTTEHVITLTGLTPATVYHYSAGSGDEFGTTFASAQIFSTASPPQTSGAMNAYFNQSVNTQVAWLHPANGNQDLTARVVTRLNAAQRSIDAALYSLSGTPGSTIANALIAAKSRGVKVRVICEQDNRTTTAFNSLASAGIPLITDSFDPINAGDGLMHDKFFVVDARGGAPDSEWVWTGSWNPTDPGTYNDFQNAIEIQDQALANVYRMEFEEMWGSSTDTPNSAQSRFGARKLDDTPHRFVIGGRRVEAYFSPSDGANWKILAVIDSAQHSVAFQVMTITRSDLADSLIARHNAGVSVRGNMDNGTDTGSEYASLVAGGVDVRLKTGASGLLHHKYCIVDAESPAWSAATLTGSHNWSSAAENSNNENTLVIHDFDITNQYLQEFTARYYQFGGTDSIRVGVEPAGPGDVLALLQNSPNPVRDRTGIEYVLPFADHVRLRLFDVQGREVRSLVDAGQSAGRYRVEFHPHGLTSGVYFYRLEVGGQVRQRKLLLLR